MPWPTIAHPGQRMRLPRRPVAGALLACGATVLAALLVPVGAPPGAVAGAGEGVDVPLAEGAPEDLSAFLENRRWGISLQAVRAAEAGAADQEAAVDPALVEMGYIGLIVTQDARSVLLQLPGGDIARVAQGERVPDGRILAAIADNTLTLKSEDGREEVLALFPRIAAASASQPG